MPRKNASEIEPEVRDEAPDALAEFFDKIESVNGAATVRVQRQNWRTGRMATLTEYPAADFDPMTLAHDFGGGSYRLQVIDGRTKKIIGSAMHEIDAAVKAHRAPHNVDQAGDAEDTPTLALLRAEMQLEFSRRENELLRQQQAAARPAEGLGAADIAKIMMDAQSNAIQMMKANDSRSNITDTLETIKAVREMMPDADAGSGGGDWASIAKAVVTMLPQLQSAAPPPPPGGNGARAALPAGENRNATQTPARKPGDDPQARAMKRVNIIIELGATTEDADAADYASVLWDALEQAHIGDVEEALKAPTAMLIQQLNALPAIAKWPDFTARVIDAMREMITPPAGEQPTHANE